MRWDLSFFSSRTSLLSVLWPRMEVTALESPECEVHIASWPLVEGWTLNRLPHITRCPGPGSWAPGISSLESDGWPSFPFSAVWPRPSIPWALGGPPPWLWRNRDTQLLADERCAVTLEHTNVCASFENEGMSSLPGGLSLVFIQSLVPDGHKKKKKVFLPLLESGEAVPKLFGAVLPLKSNELKFCLK